MHISNTGEVPMTFEMPSNYTVEEGGTKNLKIVTTGTDNLILQSYFV